MKTLNEWKYEIAFNNERYIDAKNYTLLLKPQEKAVMDLQLEFYRKHFSFDALIGKLRTADERRQSTLLLVACKNIKNILHTPRVLKQYYLKIINSELPRYKNTLVAILNESIKKSGKVNPSKKLYKAILGSYYGVTKRKMKKYAKRKMEFVPLSQKLTEFSYINQVRDMERFMVADEVGQGIFGKYSLYNTQFAYNNLFGLGEYHFEKPTTGANDLFVINSNNYALSINKLNHMIYLNLYPGKGHCLNSVYSKSRITCFDLGATYLINGWSLFAMWHYNQNTYTRNLKAIGGKVGEAFLAGNFEKGYMRAYNFLLGILPKDEATKYLILMTQYPGYLESYLFGAIATEESINKGFASSPLNLINSYKNVNLGDFFFEYK